MPAQVRQSFGLRAGRRYRERALELLDAQEDHDLVVGAFHVELELRVLVGHAQTLHRQRTDVDQLVLAVGLLAETLGPQLPVPIGHVTQTS